MNSSATQLADLPLGRRGQIAAAVATSVDTIPRIRRSQSLMRSTLYPGGRVEGLVLSSELVTVHVVIDLACYGDDLRSIGDSVAHAAEGALRRLSDARPVAVWIDDFLTAPDQPPKVS